MEAPQRSPQTHIAILPTLGMGHFIPIVEFARKLIELHGFAITFIIPDSGSSVKQQKAILETLPPIDTIFLPPAIVDNIPEDEIEARLLCAVKLSLPSLRKVLSELKESGRLSIFVLDLFDALIIDAVKDFSVPLYIFFITNAMVLSFSFHLPELDKSCACEYRDLPEPVKLPGCTVPVHGSDFTTLTTDRKSKKYEWSLEMCKKFMLADGIFVNSFLDLEPETFKAFEQGVGSSNWPPVYPVGPLVRLGSTDTSDDKAECLKWLDEQPTGSVLFVSFGSGGTLSSNQLKELVLGLEMSEQRFLLVVKRPNDMIRNAEYFDRPESMDHFEYLPTGFIERTQGKGFVLSSWAPQRDVLSHSSVGGFLTHCGWNSILESIVCGVPLIAWPLFAEQRMNSVLLSENLKVAFRVRENENGIIDSEQISKLARGLMEGEEGKEFRSRMRNLKDAAARALSQDGHSTKSLANVAKIWKS